MAKKKKTVDLRTLNISYNENNLTHKLNYLKTQEMTVELSIYNNKDFIENKTIPFAHLSKSIKKQINPV